MIMMLAPRMSVILKVVVPMKKLSVMITMPALLTDVTPQLVVSSLLSAVMIKTSVLTIVVMNLLDALM
jgi:hypothetical protein